MPGFVSGALSGSGSSLALHYHFNSLICLGVNYYTWQVLPVRDELTYLPRIVQGAPEVHIRSVQRIDWTSGACADETWIDDMFFGTVTVSGLNTLVFGQGGPGQFKDDPLHWDMLFFTDTSIPGAR